MGLLRTAVAVTGWSSLGAAITFAVYTRRSKIYDMDSTDYLLGNTMLARFNPYNNPMMKDVCVRKVPIEQIRPELLQEDGKLVEAFSAGIWSGSGYAIQRRILERKYRGPDTAAQLWTQEDLKNSTYTPGTLVTDHFEVMNKTENSIIFRGGDSPRVQDVRENDGLMELTADVERDQGVVVFGLKCVFYNGLGPLKDDGKKREPPGAVTKWLHEKYDKLLMESAIRNCMQ